MDKVNTMTSMMTLLITKMDKLEGQITASKGRETNETFQETR